MSSLAGVALFPVAKKAKVEDDSSKETANDTSTTSELKPSSKSNEDKAAFGPRKAVGKDQKAKANLSATLAKKNTSLLSFDDEDEE